jgi:hypothetical protein
VEGSAGQSAEQRRQEFRQQHGHPAGDIPEVWIGRPVELSVVGGRGQERLLGAQRASGLLEAVTDGGFVVSAGDRVVFYPREAVLQIELYDEDLEGEEEGRRQARALRLRR